MFALDSGIDNSLNLNVFLNSILDASNKHEVSKKGASTVLRAVTSSRSTGDAASNLTLSQQRAEAVRNYLIQQGVDPNVLTAKGYVEARPLASNDTEEGKFSNRRIEFTVC